jgi:septum site-determining protein MinD
LSQIIDKNDIIIVDSAAGLGKEAMTAIDVADDLIIVTNPELPAVADALKTIKIAQENGTNVLGVVVNRVKGLKHEMTMNEIRNMLEVPIISIVPEDMAVPKSISKKTPVVHHKPRSRSSVQFQKLASKILGEPYYGVKRKSWLERLFFWLD